MSSNFAFDDWNQRLQERARQRREQQAAHGPGDPFRPRDVVTFPFLRGQECLGWLVALESPDSRDACYLVPVDDEPVLGIGDVRVLPSPGYDDLSVRTGSGLWLATDDLRQAEPVTRIEDSCMALVRQRLHDLALGTLPRQPVAERTEAAPEYQDWMQCIEGSVHALTRWRERIVRSISLEGWALDKGGIITEEWLEALRVNARALAEQKSGDSPEEPSVGGHKSPWRETSRPREPLAAAFGGMIGMLGTLMMESLLSEKPILQPRVLHGQDANARSIAAARPRQRRSGGTVLPQSSEGRIWSYGSPAGLLLLRERGSAHIIEVSVRSQGAEWKALTWEPLVTGMLERCSWVFSGRSTLQFAGEAHAQIELDLNSAAS